MLLYHVNDAIYLFSPAMHAYKLPGCAEQPMLQTKRYIVIFAEHVDDWHGSVIIHWFVGNIRVSQRLRCDSIRPIYIYICCIRGCII